MSFTAEVELCNRFNHAARACGLDPLRDINAEISIITTVPPGHHSIDADSVQINITGLKHPEQSRQGETNDRVSQFIADFVGMSGAGDSNSWLWVSKNAAGYPTMKCTNFARACNAVPDSGKLALGDVLEKMARSKEKQWAVS